MKYIAVFFGGKSCEHDISVITGTLTANLLNGELFTVIPVYITNEGEWYTGEELKDVTLYKNLDEKKLKRVTVLPGQNCLFEVKKEKLKKISEITCAVNCLHGVNGEDGSLYGLLNLCGIPLVGSGLFASSLSIDKDATKIVLSGLNVDKLPYVRVFKEQFYAKTDIAVKFIERKLNYPVIVKPAKLGSSIGVSKANDKTELISVMRVAFQYDDKIIVEPYLENFREINCAGYRLGDNIIVSECEEPITTNDILSFKDKYQSAIGLGGVDKKFPADVPVEISNKIKNLTQKIYRKCDFSGIIRIDYIVTDNKILVNEINSVPGSMAYYLFSDTLKGFSKILYKLIDEAVYRKRLEQSGTYLFASNVLEISGVKGAKSKVVDKNKKR